MIKKIKIFGERNSGTNFLNCLIEKNIKNIDICSSYYRDKTGWKHGTPKLDLYDNTIDKTLFIFIIRDLEPWLKSMYKLPHHMKKFNNIKLFLTNKIIANDARKDHDINIYSGETNKTIFELRYYKINSYINIFKNVKNAIIVNLEDLQQDKGKKFINTLHDSFQLLTSSEFCPIIKHTKTKQKNVQNRQINVMLDTDLINNGKNIELEQFVKSLKEKYYIKLAPNS
tara:strand:- start:64 stop:744 length:681 start_codon:yes stop_codon:yes gene_type:complete